MASRVVAVIGGGFSGAMAAVHLARAGAQAVLVERRGRFAAGAAYSTVDPAHRLNVRARNMSAFAAEPDHFLAWTRREGLGDAETFVARRDYRRYLAQIFEAALAEGRVRPVAGVAMALEETGDGLALHLADGSRIACDRAILAGGNHPSRLPAALAAPAIAAGAAAIDDPWSEAGAAALRDLAAQPRDILLLGTGLTMVDVCLTLEGAGFAGRIVATSRRGLVPQAHAAVGAPPLPAPAPDTLAALVRHVRRTARDGDWRAAVDALRPVSQAAWQRLDGAERRRFLRHLRPWWDIHRHRIAPDVAARIAALRAAGRLELVAGRLGAVRAAEDGLEIGIGRRGGAGIASYMVGGIVNCTGPEGSIHRIDDPIVRQVVASGLARPDPLEIALDVDPQSRLIGLDGRPSERLFALGPLTRGTFWEIVAVPDIRGQAEMVARLAARG